MIDGLPDGLTPSESPADDASRAFPGTDPAARLDVVSGAVSDAEDAIGALADVHTEAIMTALSAADRGVDALIGDMAGSIGASIGEADDAVTRAVGPAAKRLEGVVSQAWVNIAVDGGTYPDSMDAVNAELAMGPGFQPLAARLGGPAADYHAAALAAVPAAETTLEQQIKDACGDLPGRRVLVDPATGRETTTYVPGYTQVTFECFAEPASPPPPPAVPPPVPLPPEVVPPDVDPYTPPPIGEPEPPVKPDGPTWVPGHWDGDGGFVPGHWEDSGTTSPPPPTDVPTRPQPDPPKVPPASPPPPPAPPPPATVAVDCSAPLPAATQGGVSRVRPRVVYPLTTWVYARCVDSCTAEITTFTAVCQPSPGDGWKLVPQELQQPSAADLSDPYRPRNEAWYERIAAWACGALVVTTGGACVVTGPAGDTPVKVDPGTPVVTPVPPPPAVPPAAPPPTPAEKARDKVCEQAQAIDLDCPEGCAVAATLLGGQQDAKREDGYGLLLGQLDVPAIPSASLLSGDFTGALKASASAAWIRPRNWFARQWDSFVRGIASDAKARRPDENRGASILASMSILVPNFVTKWFGTELRQITRPLEQLANFYAPTELPGQADTDELFIRGRITAQQWDCLTRAANNKPRTAAQVRDLRAQKMNVGDTLQYYNRLPQTSDNKAKLYKDMRELGFVDTEQVDRMVGLLEAPLPFGDMMRVLVKDGFNERIATEQELDKGFDEAWENPYFSERSRWLGVTKEEARYLWRAHWNYPSPGQLFEMLARCRPGRRKDGITVTREQVEAVIVANDMAPKWVKPLVAMSFLPLNRSDTIKGYYAGAISYEEMIQLFMDFHMDEEGATTLANIIRSDANRRLKDKVGQWTPRKVGQALVAGLIPVDEARAKAKDYFGDDISADRVVTDSLRTRQVNRLKACVASVKRRFMMGALDKYDARAELVGLGMDAEAAQTTSETWSCEFKIKDKAATMAQLLKWLGQGLLTADEVSERLARMGYGTRDRLAIITSWQMDEDERRRKALAAAQEKAVKDAIALDKELERQKAKAEKAKKASGGGAG